MHLFGSKFVNLPDGVKEIPGTVTTPAGFKASGIAAGLKRSGKRDLGVLLSESPCSSAMLLTRNAAAAAPIRVCQQEIEVSAVRAVVVNSGSANACTGEQGMANARTMVSLSAAKLGVDPAAMAVASTGVTGHQLPMEAVEPGIEFACDAVSADGGADFAEAIRTTDKIDKDGVVEVSLSTGTVMIGACAKGAGMIAPNMATLLAFVTTDARIPAALLEKMLQEAVSGSFNAITVDGDMSTNDLVLLMANGASGVAVGEDGADAVLFTAALAAALKALALKIVADGEGATKVVELNITGAATPAEATRVAREVSESSLVQTAFYGRDANWGRLMASAGAALAGESELLADIHYEELCLARSGAPSEEEPDADRLKEIMGEPEISVTIDLHRGESARTMYFSDLTHDYVTLNAEYTT